nr:E3 ubiquitin-protein ligase RLIM isoform X3 [Ziziphus jujuba var. spinosa]
MEDMDIDQVVDVPDTPDRLASRHIIGRGSVKDCSSPLAGNFRSLEPMNGLRGKGKLVTENGHGRKMVFRPPKFGNPERQDCSNSNGFSSVENSSASQHGHLFRRAAVEKIHGHRSKQPIGAQNTDQMSGKFPSKSSIGQEGTAFFDLTKQNGHTQHPRKAFPLRESKYPVVKEIPDSIKMSRNAFKGKGKIDDNTSKGPAFDMVHGKGIDLSSDSQSKSGEQMYVSHSVTSPRVSGQKRLVRNGCISPLNIETKAKQLAEQQSNSSKNVEQNQAGNAGSNHPQYVDISDIVTEDDNSERRKGKTIVIDPYTPKERNTKYVQTSSSSSVTENGKAKGTSDASGDAIGCSTENGGWRSMRNPMRKINPALPDSARHLSSRTDHNGINFRTESDHTDRNAVQTVSWPVSEVEQTTGPPRAGKIIIKRQKNQGSASRNNDECSTSISDDSDIMFIGSSRGSSNSRSSSIRSPQSRATLGPVIEIDELSPVVRNTRSQSIDDMHEDDLDARARQVEADEMLARELQEQLYHEGPIVGGGEQIDEHIAWALQQEENGIHTSAGSQNESHPRGPTMSHLYRQPRSRSSPNPSSRRGNQGRVPTSTRMAQLRNRFHRQSAAASTRARNLQFPLDMDLDMRLDILEALEAAAGDLSDVGRGRRANQVFQAQRDFNENDYEMLLALDENNHRHGGASASQINSLPQSTVQTDALEEACAVCLETPTMGEIVRHLPCLHKFHKDCIDPWLSRKTSCPVCKCSIT